MEENQKETNEKCREINMNVINWEDTMELPIEDAMKFGLEVGTLLEKISNIVLEYYMTDSICSSYMPEGKMYIPKEAAISFGIKISNVEKKLSEITSIAENKYAKMIYAQAMKKLAQETFDKLEELVKKYKEEGNVILK